MSSEAKNDNRPSADDKKVFIPVKRVLYGTGALCCLLIAADTIRELYFIFIQWNNEAVLHDILYTVRKVLAMLGWVFLTWYTANKCLEKNGRKQ